MDPAAPSQRQSAEVNAQDFLLEIRTEEIPAPALLPARLELARASADALADEGLAPASIESYATPRRLVVVLRGLPERQEDRFAEVLGPPASNAFDEDGKPTSAAQGFAKAQKVDVGELVVVDSPRGRTVAARKTIPGRAAAEVLAEVLPRVVGGLSFPKTMRWGAGDRSFVRPVRGVVALLGGQIVPLELYGVPAGDRTIGSPRPLGRGDRRDRAGRLPRQAPPELRRARRRGAPDRDPREGPRRSRPSVGGQIEAHADLANTLADLVEWPGLVRGAFAPEFLELPEEITVTVMRTHQKYLPVRGPGGLLPHFVAVMDNDEDRKGFIAKGSEWVLNARLADARFFFEEDAKESLEAQLPKLSRLTFQDKLGDYRQKTARLQDLAETIARAGRPRGPRRSGSHGGAAVEDGPDDARRQGIHGPPGNHRRDLRAPRAATRTRCGRRSTTSTVRPPARTIRRGRPRARSSRSPTGSTRSAASSASGLVPTGSKDPYGLRRAALGVVSIAIGRNWRTDWRPIVRKALSLYPPQAGRSRARSGRRGARALLRRTAPQPPRAPRLDLRRDLGRPERRRLGLCRRGRPRAGALGGPPPHGLPVADPRRQADPQHRRRRRARRAGARALPRGGRARPRLGLPAGPAGDRRLRDRPALPRGHGDDRLDRPVARPLLRRRPRQLPRKRTSAGTGWRCSPRFSKNSRGWRTFPKSWWKNETRLLVRQRCGRGGRPRQGDPRRQGRGPGGDDRPRHPGPARVHDRNLGLRRLFARRLARRDPRRGRVGAASSSSTTRTGGSATRRTRCSSRSGRARAPRCPA